MIRILLLATAIAVQTNANVCTDWSNPKKVGKLDVDIVSEASGLAISRQYADRMYHNNDSGDGGFFYVTKMDGSETQTVAVPRMKPDDVEDLSLGPCATGTCIFLADIGDNKAKRKFVEIWVVQEEETFGRNAKVVETLKLTYPDRAHNAEAMSVDPKTGDIYIVTKEIDEKTEEIAPAKLFRLRAEKRSARRTVMEEVGEIDIPHLNSRLEVWGKIATGMDISADGKKLLVLTYQNAIEINFGLLNRSIDSRKWVEGEDYSRTHLTYLQQEAIAWAADGKSFYYTTEFNKDEDENAFIYQVTCTR